MLKIHSGGSGSQQALLTIPASQLKQLASVGAGGAGLQTVLMPVGKGRCSTSVDAHLHRDRLHPLHGFIPHMEDFKNRASRLPS